MFNPDITAVMVTGKTTARYPLALGAVKSFLSQVYSGNKRLWIVNDNPVPLYQDASTIPDGVIETLIQPGETKRTLGELRNMVFDYCPKDSYIVQWDDDDWSSSDRLQYQVDATAAGGASVFKWQVQYNTHTGACFAGCGKEARTGGFAGTMLFPVDTAARFSLKPKGEDTDFLVALMRTMRIRVISNSPTMFVHFYHGNNTWDEKHVMKRRSGSRNLSEYEETVIRAAMSRDYPWVA